MMDLKNINTSRKCGFIAAGILVGIVIISILITAVFANIPQMFYDNDWENSNQYNDYCDDYYEWENQCDEYSVCRHMNLDMNGTLLMNLFGNVIEKYGNYVSFQPMIAPNFLSMIERIINGNNYCYEPYYDYSTYYPEINQPDYYNYNNDNYYYDGYYEDDYCEDDYCEDGYYDDNSRTITIPKGATVIIISGDVTIINDGEFYDNKNIESATIPDSVLKIGESAFEGCTGLTNITIPDSVITIEKNVFAGCTNLTEITLPSSLQEIKSGAFNRCPLETIYFNGSPEQWNAIVKTDSGIPEDITIVFNY